MKIRTQIDPGICNFDTVVTAETEDSRNVSFTFVSDCETIKEFGKQIDDISPVDAIKTLGPEENPILLSACEVVSYTQC